MTDKVISLMEQKAGLFRLGKPIPIIPLPPSEEVRKEIAILSRWMATKSIELSSLRENLKEKEEHFALLANYKYKMELGITPIKTLKKNDFKREQNKERDELVRELEALNPDQLEKLRTIKL